MDQGASISLISDRLASVLQLKRHPHSLIIDGILGDGVSKKADLFSIYTEPREHITLQFYMVPKIPAVTRPKYAEAILSDPYICDKTPLADLAPGGSVDLLLGSLDFNQCLRGPTSFSHDRSISATPTIFGWTVIEAQVSFESASQS